MAYDYIVLAEGQLSNSKTTLYTVPASTQIAIQAASFCNTGAGNNTVIIYLKPGSTSRRISRVVLATNEQLIVSEFTLEAGDIIEGQATNASEVDYVITGAKAT